jgi:hypothetical protein
MGITECVDESDGQSDNRAAVKPGDLEKISNLKKIEKDLLFFEYRLFHFRQKNKVDP